MKISVFDKGVVFTGKSWEIKQKLKEYQERYVYVTEWIQAVNGQDLQTNLKRIK